MAALLFETVFCVRSVGRANVSACRACRVCRGIDKNNFSGGIPYPLSRDETFSSYPGTPGTVDITGLPHTPSKFENLPKVATPMGRIFWVILFQPVSVSIQLYSLAASAAMLTGRAGTTVEIACL